MRTGKRIRVPLQLTGWAVSVWTPRLTAQSSPVYRRQHHENPTAHISVAPRLGRRALPRRQSTTDIYRSQPTSLLSHLRRLYCAFVRPSAIQRRRVYDSQPSRARRT